ncbi:MAG: SIS domain-containing protein [Lentisphaerae bacterium]|nr:SIS domain-containing protein [Lentisphaerota bacterium]
MTFIGQFFQEAVDILGRLPAPPIEKTVEVLARVRTAGGRVFVLGVGGSAAAASHFVNDLRKLTAIEAYAPTDNVSELTARINDEGWASCFEGWLKGSRLCAKDAIFIFSVGGGDLEKNISPNLVRAIQCAKTVGAAILGVVGRDGGYTAKTADACVVIPVVNPDHVTPHTESFHSLIGHLLVTHPKLKAAPAKWEATEKAKA